jgi:HEAT repeat protein
VSEQRLDELVAALAEARPVLDDVARARVAAALTAATAARAPQATEARRRRAPMTALGSAVAAAVVALAVAAAWKSQQTPGAAPAPGATHQPAVAIATKSPEPRAPAPLPPIDRDQVRKDAQLTLRSSIKEAEPVVRVQGSDALGKIKDQPSTEALAALTQKDPDVSVRGHSGEALGLIGAAASAPLLAKLEAAAPAPLKVWYASALARLGDQGARTRLLDYARNTDLAVSFKAAMTLADLTRPGDKPAITALKKLAAREAELVQIDPSAGVQILTKLTALHDPTSRKVLYAILDNEVEANRLAAAEGLARLGDDAGKKVLQDILASKDSPNRLVAAVAQIPLGDYGGVDVIMASLDDKRPELRQLAARGLGEIGEVGKDRSLRALIALAHDKDWTVRIASAAAIVSIVGLDAVVLAQASVDWTKDALTSQDWAVRKAAAGVLADIPIKDAVPLLAQAIADKSPDVRLAASKSAGKIKSAEAATKVADAVKTETDPKVKEQQVKALGEIGQIGGQAAHDTLTQIAEEPGRIGVFAAGSLIAVGDLAGKVKLELAVAAPQPELRLAAVEAASSANNKIVIPTLRVGAIDRLFNVRFAAAEGLSAYMDEKPTAVPILTAALDAKDADVIGRAMAALTRLGEPIKSKQTPAEMLDSADPRMRLAAVPAVRALPASEGVPLLRRLVADQDGDVRHAGVDAIEEVIAKDRDQAIRLYKPLVNDADPVVRSKAAGQLARLAPTPPPAPPPPPGPDPRTASQVPAVDPRVQQAHDDAVAAAAEVVRASAELDGFARDQATAIAAAQHDDTTIAHVNDLAAKAHEQAAALDAAAANAEAAVKAATDAAGASPSPDTAKLLDDTRQLAQHAKDAVASTHDKVARLDTAAKDHGKTWTGDIEILITGAKTEIAMGNMREAQQKLAAAAKHVAKGTPTANLDEAYGQLYRKLARSASDGAEKRKLLQRAQASYQRVARSGAGILAQTATEQLNEIADDLKALEPPQ